MAIEAVSKDSRVPKAKAVCDECRREEVITCDYERKATTWLPDVAQARSKMAGKGWTHVKGVDRCPSCEAKRKAFRPKEPVEQQKEPEMTNVTELRQPTNAQKMEITRLLMEYIDPDALRYRGAETDVTIAEAVGGGCMFGWVAAIRETAFGASGDNEASGQIARELASLMDQASAAQKLATEAQKLATEAQNAATALKLEVSRAIDRQAAYAKTLGPKARAV